MKINYFISLGITVCLVSCGDGESPTSPAPAEQAATQEPALPPEPTAEERYNNGAGAPSDPHEAIAWYTEFANEGVADASYRIGMCYYNNRTIPMNFVKAVEHLRKAAEQGHPEAKTKLAECYEWGVGVEADPAEATKWRTPSS